MSINPKKRKTGSSTIDAIQDRFSAAKGNTDIFMPGGIGMAAQGAKTATKFAGQTIDRYGSKYMPSIVKRGLKTIKSAFSSGKTITPKMTVPEQKFLADRVFTGAKPKPSLKINTGNNFNSGLLNLPVVKPFGKGEGFAALESLKNTRSINRARLGLGGAGVAATAVFGSAISELGDANINNNVVKAKSNNPTFPKGSTNVSMDTPQVRQPVSSKSSDGYRSGKARGASPTSTVETKTTVETKSSQPSKSKSSSKLDMKQWNANKNSQLEYIEEGSGRRISTRMAGENIAQHRQRVLGKGVDRVGMKPPVNKIEKQKYKLSNKDAVNLVKGII